MDQEPGEAISYQQMHQTHQSLKIYPAVIAISIFRMSTHFEKKYDRQRLVLFT